MVGYVQIKARKNRNQWAFWSYFHILSSIYSCENISIPYVTIGVKDPVYGVGSCGGKGRTEFIQSVVKEIWKRTQWENWVCAHLHCNVGKEIDLAKKTEDQTKKTFFKERSLERKEES